MYAFNSGFSQGKDWFVYTIRESLRSYVNVYHLGKPCFTENGNADAVLALDEGYVQKQFKQDHGEVEARSASPVLDESDAFVRAPSVVASDRDWEDSVSDWGEDPVPSYGMGPDVVGMVARNVLDNMIVEVEKRTSAGAVFGAHTRRRLAMEAIARETRARNLLRVEEENKRQKEAADLAAKNLLDQQRVEQEQLRKKQQEQDMQLNETQEREKEQQRRRQEDLEKEQATQKISDEEKQRAKDLAGDREALEERQRLLSIREQELQQRATKQDLNKKQQEQLLQQQQKAIEDSRVLIEKKQEAREVDLNARENDLNTKEDEQLDGAAKDMRLIQKKQTALDGQRDEQAREAAALTTQLAALDGQRDRQARKAAQSDEKARKQTRLRKALNRLQERQRLDAHALDTRLASIQTVEMNTFKALGDLAEDVLGKAEAVDAAQQRIQIVLDQREFNQKLQAHTFATELAGLEAIEKQLDNTAASLQLQRSRQPMGPTANGAGVGVRVGAAAGGDTTDAEAARLRQELADQRRELRGVKKELLRKEWDVADIEREAEDLYDRLGGRPPPPAPTVDPTVEFKFKDYHGALDYGDWIKAMDALCLFRDTDKSYVLFHTDWQTVLHENGLLLAKIAARAVPFRTWELSRAFFEANKGSCRLIPFWSNLYYQFGLITQRLTEENLRPWGAGQRERLIGWCRTVCTAAQGQLYKDEADYVERGAVDRRRYRKMYNSCHGCLRWFWHADNDLHVDIRFLDKIMSAYFTEYVTFEYDDLPLSHIREADILRGVFEIENWDEIDAQDIAQTLDDEVERAEAECVTFGTQTLRVSRRCRAALETISKWKWRVRDNADARAVYARIYEHARQGEDGGVSAAAMLRVQAVEHHRRYTLHEGPTGEC